MHKILVTGGNGFIGSKVAEILAEKNKVIVLDLEESYEFDCIKADINDFSWVNSLEKTDFVFHFAYSGGGIHSADNPIRLIHTELTGLHNVLQYSLKNNVKKTVYASSAILSEKFRNSFVFSKIHSNPFFYYPAAKLMGEYLTEEFHKETGIGYCIIRYYNVFGEKQPNNVVSGFIKNAIEGRPLVIFGSGKQKRDFTFVDDAAKATVLAGLSDNTYSKAVNIGTGKQFSLIELAKLVKKLTKSKSEIIFDDFPEGLKELESERISFSSSYLNELIGFECRTSLEEGLKKVIDFTEKNGTALK